MDQIQRKDKYQNYLKKVHHLKGNLDDDSQLEGIRESVNVILESLRNKSDLKDNHIIYAILLIPLIIVLVWVNIDIHSLSLAFLPLVLLAVFLIGISIFMKSVIRESTSIKWSDELTDENRLAFLKYKLEYLSSALKIKIVRKRCLSMFYILFFPILLIFTTKLILGVYPFGSIYFGILLAYGMGGIFWYLFFRIDLIPLNNTTEVISEYRKFIVAKFK